MWSASKNNAYGIKTSTGDCRGVERLLEASVGAVCDTLSNDENGVYRKLVATTAQCLGNVIVQGEAELGGTVTIDTRAVLVNI